MLLTCLLFAAKLMATKAKMASFYTSWMIVQIKNKSVLLIVGVVWSPGNDGSFFVVIVIITHGRLSSPLLLVKITTQKVQASQILQVALSHTFPVSSRNVRASKLRASPYLLFMGRTRGVAISFCYRFISILV
jgi:hypothetical protein